MFDMTMTPKSPKRHCRELITEAARRRSIWSVACYQMRQVQLKGVRAIPYGDNIMVSGNPTKEDSEVIHKYYDLLLKTEGIGTGELKWWVWRLAKKYKSCRKFLGKGQPRII